MKKFIIKVDGIMHEVEVEEIGGNNVDSIINNKPVEETIITKSTNKASVKAGSVTAPLQGTIQVIKVNIGDKVSEGDVVAVVEAMKMENDVPATTSGTVNNIYFKKGDKVSSGDVILDIV